MRGGLGGRLASGSVRSTTAAAVPEQNRSFSLWGAPFCGDECRAERALGCGRISPRGQQAGATGEEAAEGRKCDGGAMGTKSTRDGHEIYPRCEIGPALKVLSLFGPWRRREMIGYARWLSSSC